jgi:hypothetical protein
MGKNFGCASRTHFHFQTEDLIEYTEYDVEDINECVMLIYKVYRKDRDQVKAGVGKPSSVSKYYARKKHAIANIANQMM